jgi:hypothetical protein
VNGRRLFERIAEIMADPHYCKCGHYESEHDDDDKCEGYGCSCVKFTAKEPLL